MSTHHNTARMTIEMEASEHKKLKAMAALMGVTLRELVLGCLRDNLISSNVPNAKTLKAIKETEAGKNIIHCKDVDDMMKKLGL